MAFTRFNSDPCRIYKYLEETSSIGNYHLNVPGNGLYPLFINDPHIRAQKWGANQSSNTTEIESKLFRINRRLNHDEIENNNYENDNIRNDYNIGRYNSHVNSITDESRTSLPAWTLRDVDSINLPNNFKYLHYNPQDAIYNPLFNNLSSRIIDKDDFVNNQ